MLEVLSDTLNLNLRLLPWQTAHVFYEPAAPARPPFHPTIAPIYRQQQHCPFSSFRSTLCTRSGLTVSAQQRCSTVLVFLHFSECVGRTGIWLASTFSSPYFEQLVLSAWLYQWDSSGDLSSQFLVVIVGVRPLFNNISKNLKFECFPSLDNQRLTHCIKILRSQRYTFKKQCSLTSIIFRGRGKTDKMKFPLQNSPE